MLPSPPFVRERAETGSAPTALRRSSPSARTALLIYTVMLIYGSLAPWQGWRSLGVSPFDFLDAPWPVYVTGFDLTLNVLAYLPLGLLLALAIYPRVRGWLAVPAAMAFGTTVSVLLEGMQSYLPARIASNLDVLTNVAGAGLGAVAGALLAPGLIDRGRLQQARRWFRPDAGPVLLIVVLWPLAQVHPGSMLFGNGELDRSVAAALVGLVGRQLSSFDAGQFAAAEVLVTACGMLAAAAAFASGMNRGAPRVRLLLFLLVAALATKALTYGHEFGPLRAFAWLTPGAISGLAIGLLAATALATAAPPRVAYLLSVAALLVLIVTVNVVPPNPYHAHWLSSWRPGRMRDVAAASDWLAQSWPYVLLAALLWSRWRQRLQLRALRGQ